MYETIKQTLKNLTLAAMFLAAGLVLPFVTGQIPQIGGFLVQAEGFGGVLLYAFAMFIAPTQRPNCVGVILVSCFAIPFNCFCLVLLNALTIGIANS